jgi:O-antigen ligase
MTADRLLALCTVVLASSLILGGGTRPGFLSDVVTQLLAIPLLLTALWRLAGLPSLKPLRWVLLLCLAVALVPVLQLIPLPPAVWTTLPDRQSLTEALHLTSAELPWMPLSVSPRATWLSALSLLPPIAIFLATVLLGYRERRTLSLVLVGIAVLSAFLGLIQVAQGPSSSLRFFEVTNPSEAVGFFANRNHLAAALYTATVFAAAWAVEAAMAAPGRALLETRSIAKVFISFTVVVVLVAAQTTARSRAGLGLTIVALLGVLAIALRDGRNASGLTPAKLLLGAATVTVVLMGQLALYRVMDRFAEDPLQDARLVVGRITAGAARLYMPFGAGMGTFVPVYASVEPAAEALPDTYVNRAHDDFLELWLETGAIGLALMALFLLWLLSRAVQTWRRNASGSYIDVALARAASVAVALILAHSLVDYPLRTDAMMAVFAFACGLLTAPPSDGLERLLDTARRGRAREAGASPRTGRGRPAPGPATNAPISQHSSERWGSEIEWPKDWR